jgi:predicted nucleotide-binding protein
MDSRILWLREILQKIPLMDEEGRSGGVKQRSGSPSDYEIFIVHGHDYGARDAVKLFVKSLGVRPIVLEDRPNENVDIDRKLAKYSDVDYVIVILTPDDGTNPRSNAVLELGWFRKALGEERVAILHKARTNIPSDVGGVERTLMDDHGGWRQRLARDIKHAGIAIDPDWISNT